MPDRIMDFSLSAEQEAIRDAVQKICTRFPDEYWLNKDRQGGFPEDFHRAFAEAGWLGICIPPEFGGAGLGVIEAALLMQTIAESGAGLSGASALHMNIFGLNPVVVFGSAEQKLRMLPPLVAGQDKACFAVTEPDVGLDTLKLKTKAVRKGDHYVLSGQKIWISTAQVTSKMLILARTTPLEAVSRKTDGLTLFYTDLDRRYVEVREIPKMGRRAVDSNALFIDGLPVSAADRIGEEGRGFEYILHGMNPERVLIAAEGIGLGRAAVRKAAGYARDRIVFDPGDSASARRLLDGAGGGQPDGVQGGLALRQGPTVRHRGQFREVSCRRSLLQGVRDSADDPRWHGLRQGIPRRAVLARIPHRADCTDHAAPDPELHCREGAGPAEIVLRMGNAGQAGTVRHSVTGS
jgi:acyl-CoA dehydrogenase